MNSRFPERRTPLPELRAAARRALDRPGWRFGHLAGRRLDGGKSVVEALLLDTGSGGGEILSAVVPEGISEYPSLSQSISAAHWVERGLGDFFGLRAAGHPRWKSLILHDDAYEFLQVAGEGVHEIPVGPIHAGIIEPGHFRFSCLGEVIANLEIRLGYQHRGVEGRLAEVPWGQARFVAEAASSDTAVGNALAHAVAIEQILGMEAPPRAHALRSLVLEVERVASHLGDMGGLSADIGYSAGAALFARLRGAALGLAERLAGSRLQRGYVAPGGVTRDLPESRKAAFASSVQGLAREARAAVPVLLENPSAIERMEGTGRLSPSLARDFGLVGPAARASGSDYDARTWFHHALYPARAPVPACRETGDVLARAQVRAEEIASSLALVEQIIDVLPPPPFRAALPRSLPPHRVGVGVVEAWRGELIHWVTTDGAGRIRRYAVKDPSMNNWTGLAIAVRGNLVADFPLCNKSFNLSYSGNDL